jgi:hypothetical protein
MKALLSFIAKQATLMRRSIVPSLLPQLVILVEQAPDSMADFSMKKIFFQSKNGRISTGPDAKALQVHRVRQEVSDELEAGTAFQNTHVSFNIF